MGKTLTTQSGITFPDMRIEEMDSDIMEIRYSKSAAKYVETLDKPTKQRIKTAILGLTEKPPKGDIRTLASYTDGRQRLRVGKYRIVFIFSVDGAVEVLQIVDIDSRGDIYKRRSKV